MAAVASALVAVSMAVPAKPALAEGFFEFLFGGFHARPAAPVNAYAEPGAPGTAGSRGAETVHQGRGSGRSVVFCVRLCDGENFPMEHFPNATPVETCRALCPASKTKVFYGREIDGAVARDGTSYASLDTAFVYRKHLVAHCTCNGRDEFGLAPFEMARDPTLRAGDIVVTEHGLMAFNGKRGQTAAFTPVDPASIANQLNSVTAPARVSRRAEPGAEREAMNVPPSASLPSRDLPPVVDLRGQAER
jgi:hypothetical protein